ncbi:EAL domain-containing protein [Sapientia aquatica]|uniref:EAL domain-containing protein n=2 Tax=Sapientia aquatica TaxID=1549640 RepID=A0A4V3AVA0_9BURK|nr:EAL domain-containing protein [Sapientia aquatica]
MIIDDDPDVHSATTFALSSLAIQGRSLSFLHAYSAVQAKEILKNETDIAIILLDVVMEQEDAGLHLVNTIRNELGLAEVRIILRTGQPGYAPEIDAIRDFDINDYKTKSELTRTKLFTTVTSAIRSYDQICSINTLRRASDITTRSSRELISQTNLNEFAAIAIRSIIEYFNEPNINLLLFKQDELGGAVNIIAANGQFSQLLNNPTKTSDNSLILQTIELCLIQQQNLIESDHAALYLSNTTQTRYALYIGVNKQITPQDGRFLDVFSSNVSVCLDNVLLNIRLRTHAFTDPLTNLPNRLKLLHMLDQILAQQNRPQTTLALIDIDHFAETNNALGHQFGDLLLCAVAERLRHHFEHSCKLARIGSDTFSIVGHNDIVRPEIILSLFYAPFLIEKQDVQLSATIGLVKLDDYQGDTSDALKDTNIALKQAKKQQRTGYVYFTNNMGVEIRERVRLMRALNSAFQKNHLFVVYQPQVEISSAKAIGAEALLRWKTAEGKYIPPDQFIPIAEYSGLIIELGDWVLRNACFELKTLLKKGYDDFKMSVNVSQAQFLHPEFLNSVRRAISDTGVPPHLLDLEITESMAMEDPIFLMETLHQLKKIGVKISIDDFGTGFSSLSYLQKLPIDQLKIDRSFVNQIVDANSSASIPKMIIQLCQSLGLSVIAEGVEELKQAEALVSFGCSYAQGYYYSKPLETLMLHEWLGQRL